MLPDRTIFEGRWFTHSRLKYPQILEKIGIFVQKCICLGYLYGEFTRIRVTVLPLIHIGPPLGICWQESPLTVTTPFNETLLKTFSEKRWIIIASSSYLNKKIIVFIILSWLVFVVIFLYSFEYIFNLMLFSCWIHVY